MQRPLILITIAYGAGILAGRGFLHFPYAISVLFLLGILTAAVSIRIQRASFARPALVLLSGMIGMASYVYSAAWISPDHYGKQIPLDKALHRISGTVVSPLDRDADKTGFTLEASNIDGTAVTGRMRMTVREQTTKVGYGDTVTATGRLFKPRAFNNPGGFDYAAYLARSGIHYTASVKNEGMLEIVQQGSGVMRTIQNWRERIRRSFLESTVGPGSALIQAMTLGEEGAFTDDLRDRFMAAGVTHIISISGSHLGMLTLLCFGAVRWLLFLLPERQYHSLTIAADPGKIAACITLPIVLFYTFLAGAQTATLRSFIMISAGLFALLLDREKMLLHALSVAGLVILLPSPQALFDISFQLSFLSVLVIGWVVSTGNELRSNSMTRMQRIGNSLAMMVIISLAASLATGPIVSYYFNQISFIGILANMVAIPFAGMIVVPLGLFSGLSSLLIGHLPAARMNQFFADLFVDGISFFSRIPFAEIHVRAPSLLWILLYLIFLSSAAFYIRARLIARMKLFEAGRRPNRSLILTILLSGSAVVLLLAEQFMPHRHTVVGFPDAGQGDCALIELSTGQNILIDAGGTRDNHFNICRRVVAPFLWNRGIHQLDLVVLSHPHPDHMNGLLFLLDKFPVSEVWTHGYDPDLPGYDALLRLVAEKRIPRRVLSASDGPVTLGTCDISVLHPGNAGSSHDRRAYVAENDRSLVLRIRDQGKVMLFPGDIGMRVEGQLIKQRLIERCDILKVPHHGSTSSSSEQFIATVRPAVAVFTVGADNPYHHPAESVVARYEGLGSQICRTDLDGAITITLRDDGMRVDRWSRMALQRIRWEQPSAWLELEKNNMRNLWLRGWEI